jgi:hypothetical protein
VVARLVTADTMVAPTTAMRIAGSLGTTRLATTMNARAATPTVRATGFVRPARNPSANATASAAIPSASTEKPNSLGSWPTMIVNAIPFR